MAIYLKIEGVEGDSEKPKHPSWVECLQWDFGASNSSSAAYGTGLAAGTVQTHPMSLSYVTGGKASGQILDLVNKGGHIKDFTLDVTMAISDTEEGVWYQIRSKSAMITSYSTGGDGEPNPGFPQRDNISIVFGNYEHEIWKQDSGGALKTQGVKTYDITKKVAG